MARNMPLALASYLTGRPSRMIKYELYSFNIPGIGYIRYTDQQFDVVIPQPGSGSITWKANDVFINFINDSKGTLSKCSLGADPDSIDLDIAFKSLYDDGGSPSVIGSTPWVQAIVQRFFDNAYFYRDVVFVTAFGQPPIGNGTVDRFSNASDGRVNMFTGRVSTISKVGSSSCQMTIKDDRMLLDTDYPRNNYQAMCRWTLYGTGCTLSKASYANTGTVASTPTATRIPWASGKPVGYFNQGTVVFTSGVADGETRTISSQDGASITVVPPLPTVPATGDAFTAYPGCDHTLPTCTSKFANQVHFPNYPYVPPPNTTI